jgi:predicted ATP-dependent protease
MREADYMGRDKNHKVIRADDVEDALKAQRHRFDRMEQRSREQILRETMLIDTDGAVVGQVNGLSVLQIGAISFGKPTRITARVRMGQGKFVDIEREVDLAGPLHSKGMLILQGYLAASYATDLPISLQASIVFEQSYGGVDGDSASSTELYALLSALSGLPIKQGIAVTGSVNQMGQVQAIGGVNEKVEGFYDICAARGLTGDQGVMVPAANARNLMLKSEVREAVEAGRFHVWTVSSIAEGIEILTGVAAGERGQDGAFAEGTVNRLAEERLIAFAEARRRFGRAGDE